MSKMLNGIRVLELGCTEATGIAALLLSDCGAEVIRIDAPPEDYGDSASSNEDAITYGLKCTGERLCDRGKKRVLLDLREAEQRNILLRLLKTCDAVLDGGVRPEYPELSAEALRRELPGLACTAVTGYGRLGPYSNRPWSEGVIQAESGFVSTTGVEGGEGVRSGGDVASYFGGLIACIGTLIALLEKGKKGCTAPARQIDVSMMDSILFGLENQFSLYLKSGVVPRPKGNHYALSTPVGNYPCGDGKEIMISVATEAQWQAFAEALHKEEWLSRPEFANVSRRMKHDALLNEEVRGAFAAYSRAELMEVLQSRNCIYGCINDFFAVAHHRQVAERRMIARVIKDDGTTLLAPANPLLIDGERMQSTDIRAPGADTCAILGALRTEA